MSPFIPSQKKNKLPKELSRHELVSLAKEAGLGHLVDDNREILLKLTRSALWYGRYAAPRSPEDLKRIHDKENKTPVVLTSYTSSDRYRISKLANEFRPTHRAVKGTNQKRKKP